MPEDWTWGLKPFTRGNPPPVVNLHICVCFLIVFVTSFAHSTFFLFLQRFTEQKIEDAEVLSLPWTADRNTPDNGEPDSEEFVPKSDIALSRARGKTSAHGEEGDSDDVQILEVVAVMPISYAFPASTFPANQAGQVHDAEPLASQAPATSKKRTAPTGPSEAAPKKRTKKSAQHLPKRKTMPGVTG